MVMATRSRGLRGISHRDDVWAVNTVEIVRAAA